MIVQTDLITSLYAIIGLCYMLNTISYHNVIGPNE